ncbi:MAG: hypothetical protein JWP03_3091 [Phycisphaerales bacterium]|nr:hypothetical protein [Phycisphaerales bacterium]
MTNDLSAEHITKSIAIHQYEKPTPPPKVIRIENLNSEI